MNKLQARGKALSQKRKGADGFSRKQVKAFVSAVKREAGDGWLMLGWRFQMALIAEAALLILGGQQSETLTPKQVMDLYRAMCEEAFDKVGA